VKLGRMRELPDLARMALIDKARCAVAGVIWPDSKTRLYDDGDPWLFEFVPPKNVLGGGARVSTAKNELRILAIIFSQ
jgi:hypothetical protein